MYRSWGSSVTGSPSTTAGAVLSAADEIAVEAFLAGNVSFGEIHSVLSRVLTAHEVREADSLDTILRADSWARQQADSIVREVKGDG